VAIWCFQVYPDHLDVVYYHEGHGQGFDSYCEWLDARGYHGTDWMPHDAKVGEAGRLRLRGPNGAKDEFLLAATAQNLRKLAKLIPHPAPIFAT
jgi:hypothetical protein